MSKQRYLLIILLVSYLGMLNAILQFQNGFYTVLSDDKPVFLYQSRMDLDLNIEPELSFSYRCKMDLADHQLGEFPQNKYRNSLLALNYHRRNWNLEAGYRNTLYGTSSTLPLYPDWNPSLDMERKVQHQSQLEFNGHLNPVSFSAYGIQKHLRAIPIEYAFDNDFNLISIRGAERGFDDLYYGLGLEAAVLPFLSVRAGSDLRQANFDSSDLYSLNSLYLGSSLELKPSQSCRISGDFVWNNRNGESLPVQSRNMFQSSLRIQQRFGLQLNGFLSITNNSCADEELSELFLISNSLRSHLQYSFSYDPSQASYLMIGGKYSPENETSAVFAEAQCRLLNHLYSLVAVNHLPETHSIYQSKLSYYFSPVSECYLHYTANDYELTQSISHYLGIGTSIHF